MVVFVEHDRFTTGLRIVTSSIRDVPRSNRKLQHLTSASDGEFASK